jgi:hypothetical protein
MRAFPSPIRPFILREPRQIIHAGLIELGKLYHDGKGNLPFSTLIFGIERTVAF